MTTKQIFIGASVQQQPPQQVNGKFVSLLGDTFYKIENLPTGPSSTGQSSR